MKSPTSYRTRYSHHRRRRQTGRDNAQSDATLSSAKCGTLLRYPSFQYREQTAWGFSSVFGKLLHASRLRLRLHTLTKVIRREQSVVQPYGRRMQVHTYVHTCICISLVDARANFVKRHFGRGLNALDGTRNTIWPHSWKRNKKQDRQL